jgi:hypothetical protein
VIATTELMISQPHTPLKPDHQLRISNESGQREFGGMSQLKIVWRNPKSARRQRRWHELACDVGRRLYVVEELVPQGDQKRWAQAAALEVVYGGHAIA